MPLNTAALTILRAAIQTAVEEAAAEVILVKSNDLIPVEWGVARNSGRVVVDGDRVVITYGKDDDGFEGHAPSNQYIERLHEDMSVNHPNRGQAKFLEAAADDAVSVFAAAVAAKIKV